MFSQFVTSNMPHYILNRSIFIEEDYTFLTILAPYMPYIIPETLDFVFSFGFNFNACFNFLSKSSNIWANFCYYRDTRRNTKMVDF